MKHVFISPSGGAYGSERSMLALLRVRDFDAEVICPGGGALEQELKDLGVRVHPLEFGKYSILQNPFWHYQFYRELLRIFDTVAPTTVVINLDGNTALVTLAAARLGLPIVRFCRFEFRRPIRFLDRWTWNQAAAIICPSEGVANDVRNWFPLDRHQRVHRLYDAYDGERAETLTAGGIGVEQELNARQVIGFVGRLHPTKRIDVAISAFAIVHERFNEAVLLIVGECEDSPEGEAYRDELVRLAQRLGVASHVRFFGYCPPQDVPSVMATLDVCVLPSESESFGMVLIEAWAQNVPTVASDVGGCGEITGSSGGGLLAPVGDTAIFAERICELLESPILRSQLGKSGAHWVATHCRPQQYCTQFSRIVRSL